MKTSVLKGLERHEEAEMRGLFTQSYRLRKHFITNIFQPKIDEHFKAQFQRNNFEKASWDREQAWCMGYCQALTEVISILEGNEEVDLTKRKRGRPKREEQMPLPL